MLGKNPVSIRERSPFHALFFSNWLKSYRLYNYLQQSAISPWYL